VPTSLVYEVRSCWDDITQSIRDAQDFIYITGWSIYPWLALQRPGGVSMGELLKQRADEGVTVCMLVRYTLGSLLSCAVLYATAHLTCATLQVSASQALCRAWHAQ
jgi:hypothetical protein